MAIKITLLISIATTTSSKENPACFGLKQKMVSIMVFLFLHS
ncbi:hypothetical protein; putative exported protein [Xenorhabdus nematophila ATCC 19061]|uniref:Uncharacterized protein n=1 Tax=Xenorhabdus nematophila (strain ATCC 19061 / DSM 3370 / CCUG 14189 / LMG 1036 / NCIMB 9965 / AN6) TaxID=406817 RepID=D3VCN2_XENNA|nr:hypothetical protein; putative exported protein [Xenorhabdus nematophila ATCC 19061]